MQIMLKEKVKKYLPLYRYINSVRKRVDSFNARGDQDQSKIIITICIAFLLG